MASLATDLLRLAEDLLESRGAANVARRRAVSTAYYAVFHRLSALCATHLMGPPQRDPLHRRAYRALDHRQARDALARSLDFAAALGADFEKLQDVRQWADYSPASHPNDYETQQGKAFTRSEARDYVEMARRAIEAVNALDKPARRRLATLLLVRDRR